MQHIGIDLGSRQSQLCARGEDAVILQEARVKTLDLRSILTSSPPSVVILETCTEAEKVASWAREAGHTVKLVPSKLSRQLGVGDRGVKTDQRDARALSEVSCRLDLPSVHIKSRSARDRLNRLKTRQALVTARTQLVNSVRGYLRSHLVQVRKGPEGFPEAVRNALLLTTDGIPDYIEHLLTVIHQINQQVKKAETAIGELADRDPACRRLMTVPGIGPMTSLAFVSVLDDPSRFPKASSVQSYLGLTPGERSSGASVRRTGITKAGPAILRQYLTQASLTLRRCRKHEPLTLWAESVAKRRGKQVATIATARKLAGILWAMWRHEIDYDPQRCVEVKSM